MSPFTFRIEWRDGLTTDLTARALRLACPCAGCIEEGTGRPLLDPATVPADILLLGADLVGRYGLSFHWSDGHRTGIFAFAQLRRLGEAKDGA